MIRTLALALSLAFGLLILAMPSPTEAQQNPCTNANLHPNANGMPNGQVGQAYCKRLWMTPANPCIPGIWTVSPNPPFPGVIFTQGPGSDEAFICGIPTTPGTYTFTVTAGGIFVCGTICFQTQTYTVTIF